MKIKWNTIYNESCQKTMKRMPDKSVDLILTDPPYGIQLPYDNYEDTEQNWFDLMQECIPEMRRVAKMVIMPSCKIKRLPWIYQNFPPDWLMAWYKGSVGHQGYIGFNDWEPHLVYGKISNKMQMHDHFRTKSSPKLKTYGHPCPKPEGWAIWIIRRVARKNKIKIYDPFCGSGTVLVVSKKYGHSYIGSEISEKYCCITKKRLGEFKYDINKKPKGRLF